MGRWEPNARERLERAALALFVERGYDATTVAEIADRAGLTKSTFFRHFADKREVLFGGQDMLTERFTAAITAAPPAATTIDCLAAALAAAAVAFTADRHDLAPQRRAVIAANSELQERELLKRARLAAAMADALRARGADDVSARLAAEVGVLAFSTAYARWAVPGNRRPFTEIAHGALRDLQARASALGADAAQSPQGLRALPGFLVHNGPVIEVEPEYFEELVTTALDALPEGLGKLMDNVVVIVEHEPGPPGLLGLYEGVPLTSRTTQYNLVLPDHITIYRQAICEICHTEQGVADQVRRTVIHEVAHHFGIDDDRLSELGW